MVVALGRLLCRYNLAFTVEVEPCAQLSDSSAPWNQPQNNREHGDALVQPSKAVGGGEGKAHRFWFRYQMV